MAIYLTLVSADDAAGGDPAAPSSLTLDMDPEGDLLCAGAGAAACSESPDSCLDDMTISQSHRTHYSLIL